jgi:hypothetical protein
VILHPSLTSTIDRPVELSIAVSNAAMHQCFFFDINGLAAGGTGRSIVVGPAGDVLHQAGTAEEMIPIEIDFDRVRRSREVGLRGLGQPLKSFRDRKVDFPVYGEKGGSEYLRSLGPLRKPRRGSRAGLVPYQADTTAEAKGPGASGFTVTEPAYLTSIASADLPAGVDLPIPEKG